MVSFRDLLGQYRKYRGIALFSIAASSFFELLDLAVPYAIGQILNVLSGQPLDKPLQALVATIASWIQLTPGKSLSLAVLLGIIGLVTVVKSPIQPWVGIWFHWEISLRHRRDQLRQILLKILTLPLAFYDEHNPGRIANRISRGVENQTWTYPEFAGQFIPKLVRVFGIFILILFIEWRIAIAFAISFVLIFTFGLRHLNKLMKQERILDQHMENTQSRNSEIVTNIKTVKAFATEATEFKRQDRRLERELKYVTYRIHKGYVDLITWQKTVIQFSLFSVILWTLIATSNGSISLGHFITTWTVASMAYAELEPITQMAEIFSRRFTSIARVHEFIELPSGEDAASLIEKELPVNSYKFTGKIEFAGLTFGYAANHPILRDINLIIHPCETVALVGRSGSGKSTLIKLLFRYFQLDRGQILIDGQNIATLDITNYRRRLAIVHQEVDIFNGTVLDNLIYGNPKISLAQVKTACRIARVDEFIHQLPNGYHTVVGERGVRLSGGQRQRLGIARALIVDPDVLVFDEATSSLDYESERAIQLAMRSILGTRTTIIIAHRLSTIREADKIIVLDAGQIVEIGSHQELLNHQGIYHRLHALQETGELFNG
jgi:ATP-binding cassette subfamily B protein